MLLAVSRVNESVPCSSWRERAGASGPREPPRGRARARVQGGHRRRARLARPQADPAVRARARGCRSPRPERRDADADAAGGADRRRNRRRGADHSQFRTLEPSPRSRSTRQRTAWWSTRGTAGAPPRSSPTRPSSRRSVHAVEPRTGHRRRRHDRGRGRQTAAVRPGLRGAGLRPAHGAPVDARGLRGPHRRSARPRAGR